MFTYFFLCKSEIVNNSVLRAHWSTVPAAPPVSSSRLQIPNPNRNHIFNPNPNPKNKRKEKRHRNIGQHIFVVVEQENPIFITYFPKGRGRVYKRPISGTGSFLIGPLRSQDVFVNISIMSRFSYFVVAYTV